MSKQPADYKTRVFPPFLNGLRADGLNQWNANVLREFRIDEGVRIQLRADAINLQDRCQVNALDLSLILTNFGRITSQTSPLNRFYRIQVRLRLQVKG